MENSRSSYNYYGYYKQSGGQLERNLMESYHSHHRLSPHAHGHNMPHCARNVFQFIGVPIAFLRLGYSLLL